MMPNISMQRAHTYNTGIPAQVKQHIVAWEAYLNQWVENEVQLEDWRLLVPDLGHTRGRLTQYKQRVHLYWMMKSIVARAIMNSTGSIKSDPGFLEIQKEFQLVQFQIQHPNVLLGRIEKHIPCLSQSELPSSSAKDLAPMESSDEQQQATSFLFILMMYMSVSSTYVSILRVN